MLSSWFGSASSRLSQRRQTRPPALGNAQSGPSNASSVSQSTVGPVQTPGNLTSTSDVPFEEVHAHINDPSAYAPTPSLIHSTEKEIGTLQRTSDTPTTPAATTHQRDSAQITEHTAAPETLFTPQDAIIAQVFGKSVPPVTDPAHATSNLPPPSNARPSVSLMTSDSLPPPPSMQTAPSSSARPGPTLTIYDPFSGAKLGAHTPTSPSTTIPGELSSFTPFPTADDQKLWSSLERILGLQAEIAAMHADMEGVGGKGAGNTHAGGMANVGAGEGVNVARKRSRRGQTLPIGDEEPEEHEPEGGTTGGAVSEISTEHSGGEDEDDEDDVHGYGKKRRDEEFARLAEQFAQRKAAIGGIMGKLDDLSTALETFHALPPPLFDLATSPSRTNTMSSNASMTSSPPPPHVHPGRSSPLLASISPSQAATSVAPPTVPLSPPVPPISTLAPLVSFGDPSAPLALEHVVPPVLPRTALPTMMPGAPHVESPADMDPAQSLFQELPRAGES